MIRVGLVGYGTIGQVHSRALQKIHGCELVVVADPELSSRNRAQKDLGVKVVEDLDEMLQIGDLDLIDICAPTHLHESLMIKAMAAEKHIFCEKPLARTLEEGRRLVELSRSYPKKIGIGHVARFTPAYNGIRHSVEQGEIGKAGVVRTFRGGSKFPVGWNAWFADFALSGGVILDLTIHDLDFCRWLFGDVERVYAKNTLHQQEGDGIGNKLQHALIVLRFKNGVIAHIEGNWTNYAGQFYTTMEVAGTEGLISYDSRKVNPVVTNTPPDRVENSTGVAVDPYFLELQDMVEAIRADRPPLVSVEDAFGTLQLALAAVESARLGQVIEL